MSLSNSISHPLPLPPPSSSCLLSQSTRLQVQIVPKSISDQPLKKFFDPSEFDFGYEKSRLWSPPTRRKVFLNSPGKVFGEREMTVELRNVTEPRRHGNLLRHCSKVSIQDSNTISLISILDMKQVFFFFK